MKLVRFASSLAALATVFCAAGVSQTTSVVSVDSDGTPIGGGYHSTSISADGRFVVFASDESSLVPGSTRDVYHVLLRDRTTNHTELIDVDPAGNPGLGDAYGSANAISSDGRFVLFGSTAPGLVPDDTNDLADVFVRDRASGETTRVSVDSMGTPANRVSYVGSISGDGRFVAFVSDASNLVPDDTNGVFDVFVHDRATRRTIRASVDSNGAQASSESTWPVISADGRCVAFDSYASNLTPNDTNGTNDVFVHDLTTGRTERVSVNSQGAQSTYGSSYYATISGDGRFVGFQSDAVGLDHYSAYWSLRGFFVHDRTTGATTRVSVSSEGWPANFIYYNERGSISDDGRFFAFTSRDVLSAGDTNFKSDVFVHDLRTGETTRQSLSSSGAQANADSFYPVLAGDGRYVAFVSIATSLVDEPIHHEAQVFVRGRLAHDVVEVFCSGDGSTATLCPCFNFGAAHRGCGNSEAPSGAMLATTGRPSNDTLALVASGETSNALTFFVQGSMKSPEGIVFGDGVRCVGGTLTRLYTRDAVNGAASAPSGGEASIHSQSALLGDPIPPGEMRFYQAYYREPDATFCSGGGFNITNAILVGW